jgi:hypothetical protein
MLIQDGKCYVGLSCRCYGVQELVSHHYKTWKTLAVEANFSIN